MSATLNAGSFRSDDTLYAASRTLKSYLRSILMRKWDPTDPKVRFGSFAPCRYNSGGRVVSALPRKRTTSDATGMSALCQTRTFALQQKTFCYSITWSARPISGSGIVRPSAFAVFRLMTSSTVVACITGRSAPLEKGK